MIKIKKSTIGKVLQIVGMVVIVGIPASGVLLVVFAESFELNAIGWILIVASIIVGVMYFLCTQVQIVDDDPS